MVEAEPDEKGELDRPDEAEHTKQLSPVEKKTTPTQPAGKATLHWKFYVAADGWEHEDAPG